MAALRNNKYMHVCTHSYINTFGKFLTLNWRRAVCVTSSRRLLMVMCGSWRRVTLCAYIACVYMLPYTENEFCAAGGVAGVFFVCVFVQ